MKESKFIEQNKKSWQEFETDLRSKNNKAARLSKLFVQITDDLSYARTFYRFRSVKVYLNSIAQVLFNDLYRNQSGTFKKFMNFWKIELPELIHKSRIEFRISFAIFFLAFCIGIISSIYDKDFAKVILGDNYVQMTLENIKKNDPLAVYKDANKFEMFFTIAINNLMVSLRTFVFGLIASIGSIFSLIYNGVMVGAFQYFFIERGLFKESFLTIWQHGTLEISAIIIAGAAGITLGKGFIFPGTHSRVEAFKISAIRGLKIFFGITPVIILAAFIEGFLTRFTELHIVFRLLVIILSLAFVLFYFVWYPRYLSRRKESRINDIEKLSYRAPHKFDFSKILSAEEILGYTISFFKRNVLWLIGLIIGLSVLHAITGVIKEIIVNGVDSVSLNYTLVSFINAKDNIVQFFLGIITLTLLQTLLGIRIRKILETNGLTDSKIKRKRISNLAFSSLICSFIILIPFTLGFWWGIVCLSFLCPMFFLAVYESYAEDIFFFTALSKMFKLIAGYWAKLYWNSIKIFLLLFIVNVLFSTPFVQQYIQSIFINFNLSYSTSGIIQLFLFLLVNITLFIVYFSMQITTSVFSYYAAKEIVYAGNLMERIDRFGNRNIMFGFEKEL